MAKIKMPSISVSPFETNCYKCRDPLMEEALKCARCSMWMHLRCSDLPVYILLRYKTSQAQYICRACILGEGDEESLKKAQEKVEQTLKAEEDAVKSAAKDEDAVSVEEVNSQDKNRSSETKTEILNSENPIKDKSILVDQNKNEKPICKYHIMRECKHGRLGSGCNYRHPRICFKYARNGNRGGGCKKSNCKDLHPKVCHDSLDNRECGRKKCKFFHLNNTRRTIEEETPIRRQANLPLDTRVREINSYAQVTAQNFRRPEERAGPRYDSGRVHFREESAPQSENTLSFFQMDQRLSRLESMLATLIQSQRPPGENPRSSIIQ